MSARKSRKTTAASSPASLPVGPTSLGHEGASSRSRSSSSASASEAEPVVAPAAKKAAFYIGLMGTGHEWQQIVGKNEARRRKAADPQLAATARGAIHVIPLNDTVARKMAALKADYEATAVDAIANGPVEHQAGWQHTLDTSRATQILTPAAPDSARGDAVKFYLSNHGAGSGAKWLGDGAGQHIKFEDIAAGIAAAPLGGATLDIRMESCGSGGVKLDPKNRMEPHQTDIFKLTHELARAGKSAVVRGYLGDGETAPTGIRQMRLPHRDEPQFAPAARREVRMEVSAPAMLTVKRGAKPIVSFTDLSTSGGVKRKR